MNEDAISILERRLARERQARKEAESLLETYSRQLFHLNEELVSLNTQLERKVKERTAELMAARDRAIETSQAKSEFLAVMSHEIRTPMNGVLGMLRLLQRSDLAPQLKRYTDVALASGESLLGIISDILDYSKLDAGKMQLERVPFEFQSFLEDSAALYCASAQKKGIELVLSLEPPLPAQVLGDPTRLRQVLSNLLNNAIKFTEKGHVALHVTCVGGNTIHFSVVDSGIGMALEQQQAIFEPFTQADSSHTRKYGGTGLGLSICKKLVEAMGGQLNVMSAPGIGSEFSFELVLEAVKDGEFDNQSRNIDAMSGKRALIVDGYWASRVALRNMLKKMGINAVSAMERGRAGFEELRRAVDAGIPYDVVLIDNHLPDMTGAMLICRMRNSPELLSTKSVLMLNMGETLDDGVADHIFSKPVRELDLSGCLSDNGHTDGHVESAVPLSTARQAGLSGVEGARILLVDDNETNLLVAQALLSELPVQIDTVTSGFDALENITRTPYSLVLMDVQMPGIDGLETTRRIRLLDTEVAKIPVFAMTAHAASEFGDACHKAGMNGYFSKPLDPDEVIPRLRQVLATRGASHAASLPVVEVKTPPAEPAPPLATEVPTSLPGIDLPSAMARVRGSWRVLKKILLSFLHQQTSLQGTFQTAFEAADAKALNMLAHTLKGSSATVGAQTLSVMAAAIEKWASQSDFAAIERALPALFEEARKVLEGLASLQAATSIEAKDVADMTVLQATLETLITSLETDIGESQQQMERLKAMSAPAAVREALIQAEQSLSIFDIPATKVALIKAQSLMNDAQGH